MNKSPLELVVDNTPQEEDVIPAKPGRQPPSSGDWLSGLGNPPHPPTGVEFLCRDKAGRFYPRFVVVEYTFGGKIRGNVLLIPTKTLNDIKTWQWVDPIEFCQIFEFRGIIEEPNNEERD